MDNFVHSLRASQFLRHNAVFFAGSMVVGALNYLYYPVLGRLLDPSTFGEVQTLVSLFLQLGVFLTVLSVVIVIVVTNTKDSRAAHTIIFEFEKLAVLVCAAACIMAVVFGRQLQQWLQFEQSLPFAILGLALLVSVPFYIRGAYLRGQQYFGLVSAGNIVAAGSKLVLSAVLVVLGLGTIGAIGGILLAQIAACALVVWWAYKHGLRPSARAKKRSLPDMRLLMPQLRYGAVVLIVTLVITLQYSLDVIIVKYYFDPHVAGLYAGVAAVARILFFLTASIAQVLLSKVSQHDDPRANERLLKKSLVLLIGLSVPALLIMVLWPTQITTLLMGDAYGSLAAVLPKLALSVCIVAVLNLLAAYYLALRRFGIAVLTVAGAGFTYLFILLHHGSPMAVVESLLLGSATTLAAVGMWRVTERRYGA